MEKIAVFLDRQQMDRLEKIVLDNDEKDAIILLTEILKKIKSSNMGCNPVEFRTQQGITEVTRKSSK
jgi:Trp operon repressor